MFSGFLKEGNKNMRFRKANGYGWRLTNVFEMELGSRWYYINRDNIVFKGSVDLMRDLINATLAGLTVTVKGVYSREKHKLTLVL